MSEFEVLVDVKVDDSKLNNLKTEIANIGGAKNPVKIVLDTSDAQTKIASLKSDIQSLGKANISLSGASKMEASLDRIANSVDSISTSLSSLGNSASSSANKASSALNNGANSARKMANEVDKIKNSFDQLTPSDKMSRLNSSFDKLSTSSEKFGHDISKATQYFHECEDAYEALENAIANNSGITAANEKWVAALKKAENQIKINKREMENMLDPLKKVEFSNEIDLWLKRNSAAAEQFGDKLDDLKRRLQTCDKVNFNNLKSEFKQIKTQAELAGKTGLKFSDQLKTQFDRLKGYMAASFGIMEVIQGFRAMYDAVLEVDTAMTELKRVTDLSATQYSDLYSDLTVSAREYGVALNDIISATADWSRAGFDASIAKGLAEVTTMYQHIADVDYDTAVENLLTAYKGFEGELKGMFGTDTVAAVSYIGDILNELDNNYSVTAAGVGEALKRSASALDVAGNSIQETAAMVTGITEVTQDPEKAGNALKVVSMRLRGMKGQLEELGEDVDDNVVNLSKMQGQVLRLTRGKVNIFDDSGEFKSTYEIMQGIADVWHELSTIEQADLLETVAGKHRANDVAALVSNWNNVEKAVVSATNATGSAAEEHAKYVDSMQGRLNQLTAAFQSFSNTFLETDMVKGVISALTGLLDTLEKIIDTIGGVGTAGLLGGLFLGFKKRGSISNFFKDFSGAVSGGIKSFGDLGAAAQLAGGSLVGFLKTPLGLATGIGAVITVIGTVISLIDAYKQKQRELRQETIDTSKSFSSAFGTFEQAYIKYSGKSVLTVDEENELKSAIDGTVSSLGSKSSALKDVVNASSDYVTSLDAIAKAELVEQGRLAKDAKQAAKESLIETASKTDNLGATRVIDVKLPDENSDEYKAIEWMLDDTQKHFDTRFTQSNWIEFGKLSDIDALVGKYNSLIDMKNELNDQGLTDNDFYKDLSESIDTLSSDMDEYISQALNAEKASYQLENGIATTKEEFFAMREAVLSNASASAEVRDAMGQILNEQYADVFDLSSAEAQMNYIKSVTKDMKGMDSKKINTFEMFLDMKTRVNNGECTVGDYTDYIEQANEAINNIEDAETQEFLRVQLGLELDENGNIEDEIKNLKDKLVRDLTNNDVSAEVAEAFADGLSAAELDAAINLIASGEIDLQNFDIDRAMREIEEEAERKEAIRFTVDLALEVENLEKLNEAVTESLSGTGLGTEGMSAVTSMFSGLDSYDPSRLFERTANGIRLNTDEYRRLNNEYQKTNLDGLNKKMSALGDEYLETREELSDLTYGTEEYYAKAGELSDLEAQIHATEQLAAQYEGLASAYNEWQMAEEAGNQRDMYESVIEGLETVKDEISRGWVDDGTVEFLELLTGKDLSSGNLKEIESAYKSLGKTIENTSYSVKDFFTVNDDGESTSEGVYNFLDAVGQLEEEAFDGLDIVKRDKDGNIVSFDFRIAGGDKAIADALGISEELVGIMVRAADDAGFVVSMDGTYQQLDVLKEKAAEAAKSLKDTFKVTEHSFFQDGSAEGILNDYNEAMKVWETFKANKNADGTVNMSVEGAEEAFTLVSTLQSMVDQLNEPVYMDINASEVEKEMQTPLSKLQEYERLTQTEHQLKLKGTDTSELDASQEKILDYFEGLDPEIKAQLGIENLSREELQAKVEAGEIEIPATVDLQVEMNDTLKDMVNVALYNAGVIDKKELEARVDVSLYAEKVDTSDVENKTKDAVENAGGDDKKTETTANVDVEAGEVDISDVADKTKEAIENVSGEKTDVEKSVDLEVKIDEYNELIENLEDADKDIKIKVTVEGLDQVQELNKNIDLATEIDGDIDNLSEFVEGAKALSELDSSIATYVTAEVNGNVIETPEYMINNLKTFAESAQGLKDVGSPTSNVTANVDGNVVNTWEEGLDNLKVFSDSAKDVKNIGNVSSSVDANISGNVTGMLEESIDNLKTYSESAKDVDSIGDVTSSVNASIHGNVTGMLEESIDNLKAYSDSAKDVASIGDVTSSVNATISGNVTGMLEESIDNLKAYSESARDVASIGEVTSSVNASVNGNVTGMLEESIDNLKVYSDSAKNVASVGEVTSSVSANISGNVTSKSEESIDNIGVFADNANKLKGVGSPTSTATANIEGDVSQDKISTLKDFNGIASALKSIGSVVVSVTANIAADAINGAIDLLNRVANSGLFKDYNANVNVTAKISSVDDTVVQNYQVPPKDGKATYTVDSSQVDSWTAPPKTGTITYSPVVKALTDLQKNKTGTIRYTPIIGGVATGTAFAGGSSSDGASGRAFARGDWGIKGNGVALGGELGQELVVRDGHFFTIGDNGAEFFNYRQGDIVFNAAQTESLFRYGGIKGAKPRGTMLASGTAFAGGSFPFSGKAFGYQASTGNINGSPVSTWNDSSSSSSSKSSKSKSSSSSDDADEFLEKMDWIEIAIDRIERAISKLDLTASSVFKKWSTRNKNLIKEIAKVQEEIDLQERGAARYLQEANSVGLSYAYKKKVQNGEINIEEITDEDLKEKIDEYEEWYTKYLDCLEAAEELRETENELYAQRFENIQTEYDGVLSLMEAEKNLLEEYINQSEANAWLVSANYYTALADSEQERLAELKEEEAMLLATFNEIMNDSGIDETSEQWVEMCESINDVTLAIAESETALMEYQQTLQQLNWEVFDLLQDRISKITDESEFLIDLMNGDKLYDDKGQFTDQGTATAGLYGVNYNVAMAQADQYAEEIKKIEKELAKDPFDTDLKDRYYELVEAQQDAILSAQDYKENIRDLVEEGIELELDALNELIDKHNEALDSQKD